MMVRTRCEYCDGRIVETRSTERFTVRGKTLVIDGCPIGLCPKCGEKYYPARVLRRAESLAKSLKRRKRVKRVPMFTFDSRTPCARRAVN